MRVDISKLTKIVIRSENGGTEIINVSPVMVQSSKNGKVTTVTLTVDKSNF